MPPITRRSALLGTLGVAGAGALEAASLGGSFDHRRALTGRYGWRFLAAVHTPGNAVVHVGHSTHWLSVGRARMLTDPWFFDPAFGALAHARGPAVSAEEVGPLDAILVSHDHPDHADPRALDRLDKRATVVVATHEHARRVRGLGFGVVEVLEVWGRIVIGGTPVTAVPAVHDVAEVGFVVGEPGRSVYFAGDTAFHGAFDEIRERLTPRLALLPVDGTRFRGGRQWVMDPGAAARAARALGVKQVIPTHAEARYTDPLAAHVLATHVADPVRAFERALRAELPGASLIVPSPGERVAAFG